MLGKRVREETVVDNKRSSFTAASRKITCFFLLFQLQQAMASLSTQRENFRKRMAAQPVLQRATPVAKPSDTSASGTSVSDAVGSPNRLKRGRNSK
jgi:hypothetical protein